MLSLTLLLQIVFVVGMFMLAVGMSVPAPAYLAKAGAWTMAICGLIYLVVANVHGVA